MLAPITAPCLEGSPGIRHGFFTRHGGVSQGIYASLNCGLGSQDEAAAVRENRARVAAHLQAASVLTAHQIHSPTAVVVTEAWPEAERPRADALVTATRGIAVGVLAADCTPVLFADPVAGVVAAAHAGWRGAIGGVLESTIASMEGLGARRADIRAAVGPCIGQDAYEVGWDFERDFLQRDPDSRPLLQPARARGAPAFRPARLRAAPPAARGNWATRAVVQPAHILTLMISSAIADRRRVATLTMAAKSPPSS